MEAGTKNTQVPAEGTEKAGPVTDQGTLSGGEMREVSDGRSSALDAAEPAEAVRGAAQGKTLTTEGQSAALQWFMSQSPDPSTTEVKTKKLNFGTSEHPEWVEWKVRPIGLDVLRGIRKKAAASREARRTGAADEYVVNLEIVVAATIDPDLREASRQIYEAGIGPNDPVENLRARFQGKPGYITQLAGEILGLSGFNDDDIQDADALEAAKNS